MTGLFRYGRLPGYGLHATLHCAVLPTQIPKEFCHEALVCCFLPAWALYWPAQRCCRAVWSCLWKGAIVTTIATNTTKVMIATIATKAITPHRYGHPPPPRAERRPRPPGPGYAWSQGRWVWSGQRYHWQPGRWHYVRPAPPPHVRPGPPPTPIALGRPHMPSIRPGGTAPQRRLAPGLSAPMGHVPPPAQHQDPRRFFPEDPTPPGPYRDRAGRCLTRVQRPCNATGLGA